MNPARWLLGGSVVPEGRSAVATSQITKRLIDSLKPRPDEYFIWDGSLSGFGVRVQLTGAMSYVVKYRAGSGRSAPTRRLHARGPDRRPNRRTRATLDDRLEPEPGLACQSLASCSAILRAPQRSAMPTLITTRSRKPPNTLGADWPQRWAKSNLHAPTSQTSRGRNDPRTGAARVAPEKQLLSYPSRHHYAICGGVRVCLARDRSVGLPSPYGIWI